MSRRLMKALEDLSLRYDGTVRNSTGASSNSPTAMTVSNPPTWRVRTRNPSSFATHPTRSRSRAARGEPVGWRGGGARRLGEDRRLLGAGRRARRRKGCEVEPRCHRRRPTRGGEDGGEVKDEAKEATLSGPPAKRRRKRRDRRRRCPRRDENAPRVARGRRWRRRRRRRASTSRRRRAEKPMPSTGSSRDDEDETNKNTTSMSILFKHELAQFAKSELTRRGVPDGAAAV